MCRLDDANFCSLVDTILTTLMESTIPRKRLRRFCRYDAMRAVWRLNSHDGNDSQLSSSTVGSCPHSASGSFFDSADQLEWEVFCDDEE